MFEITKTQITSKVRTKAQKRVRFAKVYLANEVLNDCCIRIIETLAETFC